MPLVSLKVILDHAAANGYGVPAFNVNNMEQIRAIMEAAHECDSAVILQGSAGARKYAGAAFLRHLVEAALEEWSHIPLCLHQDHGASPAVCARSIQSGFSSVMMDGSLLEDAKTPSDYAYNVEVTRRVVDMAHACGVSVEGELGVLGSLETLAAGKEDGVGAEGRLTREQMLTDPDQAAAFVAETGVDALAIAIGTSHGAYKFTRPPTGEVLAIDRIREIHRRVPDVHLVMHGSSSVPQEWLGIINAHGGGTGNGLRRAGGRDPGRDPQRGAQGQYRHRPASGGHRGRAQASGREPGQFRLPEIPGGRRQGHEGIVPGPFPGLRSAGWAARITPRSLGFMADVYARSRTAERPGLPRNPNGPREGAHAQQRKTARHRVPVPSLRRFQPPAEELVRLEEAGVTWVHWDVMDGNFVPNITLGPQIMAACARKAACSSTRT
jgi:fructose-bisphosphate aldolase class II